MFYSNKKADSLIVSYVLLVLVSLAIAGVVYLWLKSQTDISDIRSCPEGISFFIKDLNYSNITNELIINLSNNGRFSLSSFLIRVNNKSDAKTAVYSLGIIPESLEVGTDKKIKLNQTEYGINISKYGNICIIEIQAYRKEKNEDILCDYVSSRRISC